MEEPMLTIEDFLNKNGSLQEWLQKDDWYIADFSEV